MRCVFGYRKNAVITRLCKGFASYMYQGSTYCDDHILNARRGKTVEDEEEE